MKCQGILRQTLQSSDGFPVTLDVTCGQTVGVRTWWDAAGEQRAACHAHTVQVNARSYRECEEAHARSHEWGRLNEYQTLRMIRPEAQR